jgi:hypothetical protein
MSRSAAPGGALALEHDEWIATTRRDFLFPVSGLSMAFRSKYLDASGRAYRQGELQFTNVTQKWREPRALNASLTHCPTNLSI